MKIINVLKDQLWFIVTKVIMMIVDGIRNQKLRSYLYCKIYYNISKDTLFGFNVRHECRSKLFVGDNCLINTNFSVIGKESVNIGNYSYIAPNVTIITTSHFPDSMEEFKSGVKIGKKCWIGANVIILPGVIIGDGVVIGAGSIVVKNISDNTIAVGNPAKVIKSRKLANKYRLPGGGSYVSGE